MTTAQQQGKDETGARGQLPTGLTLADVQPDTAFSVLEVDEEVERHDWSAAPLYPPELRIAIVTWIERTYHRRRRQTALGRLTPVEFEAIITTPASQAA